MFSTHLCTLVRIEPLTSKSPALTAVQVCQCEDGQYRYALDFWGCLRGFCGPIKADCPGYPSLKAASDAGRDEMLRKFPTPQAYDPEKEYRELVAMRTQIEAGVRQPSLF